MTGKEVGHDALVLFWTRGAVGALLCSGGRREETAAV